MIAVVIGMVSARVKEYRLFDFGSRSCVAKI